MADVEINGVPVLSALINEPRIGVWHADVAVDSDEALSGQVTLEFGTAVEFVGTVLRGGVEAGRSLARIVGGAGGLGKEIPAKFYRGISFGAVLADVAALTGETLDGTSADAVINRVTQLWQVTKAPASHAIESIVDEVGADWRIFRSGTLWLGTDSFPAVADADSVEIESMPEHGQTVIAPGDAPIVAPGVTFEGRRVSYVTTRLDANSLRQAIVFED